MNLLLHYQARSKKEQQFKLEMLSLLQEKGEQAFYRENTEAHFTASAWILNPTTEEVLLIHHKKLNKWLQPGGHADGETDLEQVARKEAKEETGLDRLKLVQNKIFDIDIHLIPEKNGIKEHFHYDVRFAYFCETTEKTQINEESNSFQWIPITNISQLTTESSIIRMANKSNTILNGK